MRICQHPSRCTLALAVLLCALVASPQAVAQGKPKPEAGAAAKPAAAEPISSKRPAAPPVDPTKAPDGVAPEVRARARKLATEGLRLIREGRANDGVAKLREAQSLVPVPTISLEVARALVTSGRFSKAIDAYRETTAMTVPSWLKGMPRIRQVHAQRQARQELAALVKRIPKVRVVLLGPPADRLTIDGQPRDIADLDRELLIDPGIHVFEASSGETTARKEVELKEGQAIKVALRLDDEASDEPAVVEPDPVPVANDEANAVDGDTLQIIGFVALGVAGAALGATIGTWVTASGLASDLEASCPDDQCDPSALGSEGMDDLDSYRTLRSATIALGVVTGVVAAAGVSLVLVAPPDDEAGVSLRLGPGQLGVHARF